MKRFFKRHSHRIKGTLSGFDRVLFRGTLRSISYCEGLMRLLSTHSILLKDFVAFAKSLSDQIKDHAEAFAYLHNRPYLYLESPSISKEETACYIMHRDQIKEGLVCVLRCVEPCQSFSVYRDKNSKRLVLKSSLRKCLFLYFYFLDPQFGLIHVRLATWFPFSIQVCINGREWLARQLDQEGIGYVKDDNCFTHIDNIKRAQELIDSLTNFDWSQFLGGLAEILNPIIGVESPLKLKPYYWSIRQCEYATDLMFKDEASLAEIYPRLVNYAIEAISSRDVLRFLGRRTNSKFKGEASSNLKQRVEGIRVRHWVEENSIKMYDKAGSVLRMETTINNPRRFKVRRKAIRKGKRVEAWLPMRKAITDIKRRVEISRGANSRYLQSLSVVGASPPSSRLFDEVSKRLEINGISFRALRPISPEDSRLFEAIMKGEHLVQGFRNKDLREELASGQESDEMKRRRASSRTTRQLRLLRAHRMIYKVQKTNYYRVTKKGEEVMATALKFRQSEIALLAT